MRLHTDRITLNHVVRAARDAGANPYKMTEHGSRSHEQALEVNLEGTSPHRTQNDRDRYAATYDQWGYFLAALYLIDPTMKAGPYKNADDFRSRTHGAF